MRPHPSAVELEVHLEAEVGVGGHALAPVEPFDLLRGKAVDDAVDGRGLAGLDVGVEPFHDAPAGQGGRAYLLDPAEAAFDAEPVEVAPVGQAEVSTA